MTGDEASNTLQTHLAKESHLTNISKIHFGKFHLKSELSKNRNSDNFYLFL